MFERFTDRARRVVVLAQDEARMLNHNYIGTEHILVGLLREDGGVAGGGLESLGISVDAVRQQVEQMVGIGEQAPSGHVPFTPRAKKVLELSLREALQLGHDYISTGLDLRELDREIAQVRRDKEAAIEAQDFENSTALGHREKQLADDRTARQREWAALPSLSEEIERLRDLLRQHGIDPQDGAA
jgi:ATP-dependent Clp protease ATP-binding subunit ClpA